MEKSQGHITFAKGHADRFEFFVRDGAVYRAPVSCVIMPDGYRTGRWECDEPQFRRYRDVVLSGYDLS